MFNLSFLILAGLSFIMLGIAPVTRELGEASGALRHESATDVNQVIRLMHTWKVSHSTENGRIEPVTLEYGGKTLAEYYIANQEKLVIRLPVSGDYDVGCFVVSDGERIQEPFILGREGGMVTPCRPGDRLHLIKAVPRNEADGEIPPQLAEVVNNVTKRFKQERGPNRKASEEEMARFGPGEPVAQEEEEDQGRGVWRGIVDY